MRLREWRAYLAYLRPKSFLPTFIFVLTGYCLALPHDPHRLGVDLALLFLTYSVGMWGGSNAFNSSQDRDVGPVNLLTSPPPPPPNLAVFGIAVMALGVLLSLMGGWVAFLLTLTAFFASIYYSWIQRRWKRGKAIPGADILINAVGCGLGSVLAGYAFTGAAWSFEVWWVGLAFTVAIFGGLPTSQLFQLQPGSPTAAERNYSSCLGPQRTLRVGACLFLVHLAMLSWMARVPGPFFWGWFSLVAVSALHSFIWSFSPWTRAYSRMIRQFILMSLSQVSWILFVISKHRL